MEAIKKTRELSYAISNLEKFRSTKDKALLRHLEREVYLKRVSFKIAQFLGEL